MDGDKLPIPTTARWFATREDAVAALPELLNEDDRQVLRAEDQAGRREYLIMKEATEVVVFQMKGEKDASRLQGGGM